MQGAGWFETEKARFPESAVFMGRLLARLAGSDRGRAAIGLAAALAGLVLSGCAARPYD